MTPRAGSAVGPLHGASWLHRLDPRAKLAWLVAVIAFCFATYHPVPLFAMAVLGIGVAASAGILKEIARVLLVFAPIIASMIVIQTIAPVACRGGCAPTTALGPLSLYAEGMTHGLSLTARVLTAEIVGLAVVLSTHPSDLFAALARLRVPYVLNFMLAMTLQLVPILQREVVIVLAAQRSRGMRSTGFGSIIPSFVPVFVGAFERMQRLAIGLESRGFGSSGERTSYRRIRAGWADAGVAIAGLVAGVVGVALGLTTWSTERTVALDLPPSVMLAVFLLAAGVFVGMVIKGSRSLARM